MNGDAWAVKILGHGRGPIWVHDRKGDMYGSTWFNRQLFGSKDEAMVHVRAWRASGEKVRLVRISRRTRQEMNAMLAGFWDRSKAERVKALEEAVAVCRTRADEHFTNNMDMRVAARECADVIASLRSSPTSGEEPKQ